MRPRRGANAKLAISLGAMTLFVLFVRKALGSYPAALWKPIAVIGGAAIILIPILWDRRSETPAEAEAREARFNETMSEMTSVRFAWKQALTYVIAFLAVLAAAHYWNHPPRGG